MRSPIAAMRVSNICLEGSHRNADMTLFTPEHHAAAAPYALPPSSGYGYGAPPPAPPVEPPLEYNPELSSSQRSSLQEAREDLEEAKAEVANESDPSSSDVEELRETEEEYASEVESAHDELED